ncbi:MAG: VWA domain-containing protein, partial [Bryobacteraceae bacterium]
MRWTASLTLLACLSAVATAQEVTLRSGVSEILVDVVVRDKRGRLVHGLGQDQFRITEDAKAQGVTSWREIRGAATAPAAAPSPAAAPQEVYVQAAKPADSAVHLARQLRLVSLVFDKLGDDGRKISRKAALDFLDRDLGPNVYYAVFYVDRYFKVVQTYTNNAVLLRQAVERATSGTRNALLADTGGLEVINQQTSSSVGAADAVGNQSQGAAPSNVNGGSLSDEQANAFTDKMLQLSDRLNRTDLGQVSIFSLWSIIKQLERLPGRKSVLYFSEGYSLPNELWMQFASLISDANRANVVVYAMDPRGLMSASDSALAKQTLSQSVQMSYRMTRTPREADPSRNFRAADFALDSLRANGQMVLRELAESTGGILIANTNDLRPQLQKLSEDFNTWYELTYHSSNPDYDGRFRAIQVALPAHPDYVVQSRAGYFALPPMEGQFVFPYEVPLLRALGASPLPRDVDFLAAVIPYRQLLSGTVQSSLVFDLPLKSVQFSWDEKSKTYITHLSALALVKDEHGQVVAKLSRDVPLGEPKERLEGFKQGHFILTLPVDLAPGRYVVESVAADQLGNRFGARRASLFIPAPHPGPALSGLALLRRLEPPLLEPDRRDPLQVPDGRVVPTLSPEVPLSKDTLLSVFFKLYPDAANPAPPRLVIDLLRDGKLLSRSSPDLPKADEKGEIPYLANLPVGALT